MSSIRSFLLGLLAMICATQLFAVTIGQFNTPLTEDFDTLAAVTSSVVPAGWQFVETGSSANTTYGAGTGSSSTGNTYSFGATGSTERAFGSLRTSGVASTFGTIITNDTGGVITDLALSFVGEQWRLGALGRIDQLDFSFSLDATSVDTGTWFDVDSLDILAPVTSGITGALDGNLPENQLLVSFTIGGLTLASGTSLWLRWVDFDAAGSDDGLAIDSFSISALQTIGGGGGGGGEQAVPENLPIAVIAAAMAGLFVLASKRNRIRAA